MDYPFLLIANWGWLSHPGGESAFTSDMLAVAGRPPTPPCHPDLQGRLCGASPHVPLPPGLSISGTSGEGSTALLGSSLRSILLLAHLPPLLLVFDGEGKQHSP